MRHHEHQQLQPRRLGHLSGDATRFIASTVTTAFSATVSFAAAIPDAAAVAGATAASVPAVFVRLRADRVQRALPSSGCGIGVPIGSLEQHAPLRGQRSDDVRLLRGRRGVRHLEYQQLQPRRLGHLPACSEGRIADSAAPLPGIWSGDCS